MTTPAVAAAVNADGDACAVPGRQRQRARRGLKRKCVIAASYPSLSAIFPLSVIGQRNELRSCAGSEDTDRCRRASAGARSGSGRSAGPTDDLPAARLFLPSLNISALPSAKRTRIQPTRNSQLRRLGSSVVTRTLSYCYKNGLLACGVSDV
jgi:hypothetical protein